MEYSVQPSLTAAETMSGFAGSACCSDDLTGTVEALHNGVDPDDRARNVLVPLTGSEIDHRLAAEAGRYAACTGGHVVLVSVMSSREFATQQRALARITALPQYTLSHAREKQHRIATRIGREVLDPLGFDYTAVGLVGRMADQVLIAARAYDCGHVFLATQTQSILRRLVRRDPVQAITHRFDGLVTMLQDTEEEASPIKRTLHRLSGVSG